MRPAFTLLEMLVVMALITILISLAVPAVNSLGNASSFSKAITDLSSSLEQARAYAMANNTYVFVGIEETDVGIPSSRTQQSGVGRVAISVVASRDGTSNYIPSNAKGTWKTNYNKGPGTNLIALNKLQYDDNVHLVYLDPPTAKGGPMNTRQIVPSTYRLANPDPAADSVTPFPYPLGKAIDAGQYNFVRVIVFDAQGSARVVNAAGDSVVPALEIGLQPSRGSIYSETDPDQLTGNFAAIQVDGITGAVRIFRP